MFLHRWKEGSMLRDCVVRHICVQAERRFCAVVRVVFWRCLRVSSTSIRYTTKVVERSSSTASTCYYAALPFPVARGLQFRRTYKRWSDGVHISHTAVRMVAASLDSPTWTFGLNPKHHGPRVPGPGTYDVSGRLDVDSVGTHFSRIGAKPTYPRADVKRLVFGTGRLHASRAQRVPGFRCTHSDHFSSAGNGLYNLE